MVPNEKFKLHNKLKIMYNKRENSYFWLLYQDAPSDTQNKLQSQY